MTSVLGIFRAACYSPGMVERDEAILRAVAERLQRVGYAVRLVREEDFTTDIPIPDIVLHMARSPRVLDILQSWQEAGCRVINSVEGVRGVERAALAEMCAAQGIPTPKTWIVGTANSKLLTARTTDGEDVPISFPCWVKRTGSCAQAPDDVSRVDDAEGYVQCLSRFHARHIDRVVVMEHLEGVGLQLRWDMTSFPKACLIMLPMIRCVAVSRLVHSFQFSISRWRFMVVMQSSVPMV